MVNIKLNGLADLETYFRELESHRSARDWTVYAWKLPSERDIRVTIAPTTAIEHPYGTWDAVPDATFKTTYSPDNPKLIPDALRSHLP